MLLYNVVEWCPVAPNNFIRFIHIKIFFWSYFSVSLKVVVNLRVLLYFFFQWRNLLCWNPLLQCKLACLTRVHLEFLKESSNFGGILPMDQSNHETLWSRHFIGHCYAKTSSTFSYKICILILYGTNLWPRILCSDANGHLYQISHKKHMKMKNCSGRGVGGENMPRALPRSIIEKVERYP